MLSLEQYKKEKKTIDIYEASKLAVVLFFVPLILLGLPFYFLWRPVLQFYWYDILIFSLLFIVGIVLHELIHGLIFGLFAESGFKSIRFGFLWSPITPYCHCVEPLKLRHYIIGALMPAIILGLIPAVISIFNGNLMLLIIGVFFISAAAGDIMVIWILRKESMETLVLDHPSEPGCFIYRKHSR